MPHHFARIDERHKKVMNDNDTFKKDMVRLRKALLSLKTDDECELFLEDILTIQEKHAISQRLKVAKMLKTGMTCHHIAEDTGASTATISRVNKCLNYGPGGYATVLGRLGNED